MIKYRPFLKWAGNKLHCIEHVLGTLPESTRLIEPFTGSGAVFLNSNYSKYLLAEHNQDLVSLFKYVQKEGPSFINDCEWYFKGEFNDKTCFYALRSEFNECTDQRKRAILFLYLNRHGYNGLCRYNGSGGFNVPFGQINRPYFPRIEMTRFHHKSKHAQFIQADFRETFKKSKPGDVIYCDPPYVPLSNSANFSNYSKKTFTLEDQIDLANLAIQTAKNGIPVIISNHDTSFTREQYYPAQIISFPVRRTISCKGNNRQKVQELLAIFKPSV